MKRPGDITAQVRQYVEMTGCPCLCTDERSAAVEQAVEMAAAGEGRTLILLLGRGSEKIQRIGNRSCEYSADARLMKQELERYDGYRADGAGSKAGRQLRA